MGEQIKDPIKDIFDRLNAGEEVTPEMVRWARSFYGAVCSEISLLADQVELQRRSEQHDAVLHRQMKSVLSYVLDRHLSGSASVPRGVFEQNEAHIRTIWPVKGDMVLVKSEKPSHG